MLDQNQRNKAEIFLSEVLGVAERSCGTFLSLHSEYEAYAVILRALDNFWDEVKKSVKSKEKMRHELRIVVLMCVNAVMELELKEETFGTSSINKGD